MGNIALVLVASIGISTATEAVRDVSDIKKLFSHLKSNSFS